MSIKTHLEEFIEFLEAEFEGDKVTIKEEKFTDGILVKVWHWCPKWEKHVEVFTYASYSLIDNEFGRLFIRNQLQTMMEYAVEHGPKRTR